MNDRVIVAVVRGQAVGMIGEHNIVYCSDGSTWRHMDAGAWFPHTSLPDSTAFKKLGR